MDHTRERFIPWLAVITADSQEGQMFERRWRGKILNQFLLRFNCRRRTVAWHLRDLVLSSATLFLYFIILPQHPFPTSILIYSPIFRCFFCTFRLLLHLFLSLLRFFFSFLFPFAILIHVSFRWAFRGWTTGRGNEMDNRTAVRSQGRICLPFSSRAVWEKGKVRIRRFTDLFSSPQQFGILADSFVLIHLFSPLKASLYIITNTAYTNGLYIYRI